MVDRRGARSAGFVCTEELKKEERKSKQTLSAQEGELMFKYYPTSGVIEEEEWCRDPTY